MRILLSVVFTAFSLVASAQIQQGWQSIANTLVIVDSTVKVGIGELQPLTQLHVNGEITSNAMSFDDHTEPIRMVVSNGNGTISSISMPGNIIEYLTQVNPAEFELDECGAVIGSSDNPAPVRRAMWRPEGNNVIYLCEQDRVGIGTKTPGSALTVKGNISLIQDVGEPTSGIQFSDGSMQYTAAQPVFKLENNVLSNISGTSLHVSDAGANNAVPFQLNSNARKIFFSTKLGDAAYSGLAKSDDFGLFWNDKENGWKNANAGLVLAPQHDSNKGLRIDASGHVGINTNSNLNYALAVNGDIAAKRLKITLDGFADYVFEEDYDLMPLEELEQVLKHEKSLPEIPSVAELEKGGMAVDVGEFNVQLLKKIEELTLYVIDLQNQIKELKDEN